MMLRPVVAHLLMERWMIAQESRHHLLHVLHHPRSPHHRRLHPRTLTRLFQDNFLDSARYGIPPVDEDSFVLRVDSETSSKDCQPH